MTIAIGQPSDQDTGFEKKSAVFAVKTHWNTFLCVDKRSGSLRHRVTDEVDELVLASVTEIGVSFGSNYNPPSDIYNRLTKGQFTLRYLSERQVRLKMDGWMSAELNGDITASRAYPFDWETFFLVPVSELPDRLGQNLARPIDRILSPSPGVTIPKEINHIYINRERKIRTVPDFLVQHTASVGQRSGASSSRIWTLIDLYDAIMTWYGAEIFSYFMMINPRYPAAQADLFRYLLIYKLGGIYLDITADIEKPLDHIFSPYDGFILSHWTDEDRRHHTGTHKEVEHTGRGEYQQWFLISQPGHPYLERVILKVLENIHCYKREIFGVGRMGILRTTGPIPYTTEIFKIVNDHRHKIIDYSDAGLVFKKLRAGYAFGSSHYSIMNEDVII